MFVQFGGLMLMINVAQITLATVLMVVYSPLLGLVVWLCFVPLFIIIRRFQGIVGRAYTTVRERVGDMLGAISEAVVGAQAIRAYGVEDRTAAAHRRRRREPPQGGDRRPGPLPSSPSRRASSSPG